MPPPGRAGFLARRAGGPWTVLGQMLPKALRRPPCSMLEPRPRPRPRLQPRCCWAPSAPRPARRRPESRGTGGRGHGGGCPPAFAPPGRRNLPPPPRAAPPLPRPRNPSPRPRSLGGPGGAAPEGNTRTAAVRPASTSVPRSPPRAPAGHYGRQLGGWAGFYDDVCYMPLQG